MMPSGVWVFNFKGDSVAHLDSARQRGHPQNSNPSAMLGFSKVFLPQRTDHTKLHDYISSSNRAEFVVWESIHQFRPDYQSWRSFHYLENFHTTYIPRISLRADLPKGKKDCCLQSMRCLSEILNSAFCIPESPAATECEIIANFTIGNSHKGCIRTIENRSHVPVPSPCPGRSQVCKLSAPSQQEDFSRVNLHKYHPLLFTFDLMRINSEFVSNESELHHESTASHITE
jgi:hypothetical protein